VTAFPPPPADNRRAIVRIVATEMVRIAGSMAKAHDNDVIEYFIFTAIWVLNSNHLVGDGRYAALRSIPPDAVRRPLPIDELKRALPMPDEILLLYVDRLIAKGVVEQAPSGLVVPTAVFTQPEMLEGTNELYDHMVHMVTAMRGVGFSFGERST